MNGRIAAASRSDPLYVTGDGERTVAQLVDEVNADPRRGLDAECPLDPVAFDETTLATVARQGYEPGSVPTSGATILVRRNGNHSANVTNRMHPDNCELCLLAAQAIGLDVAGIDLVVEDLSRPIREQGGAILEVNAMPGLLMHLHPGSGPPVPVDDMLVEALFPPGAASRIPIVAVNSPLDGCARAIGEALEAYGLCTGVVSSEGVFVGGHKIRACGASAARATLDLLLHPAIEAAVIESPDDAIRAEGLGFDQCQIAVFDHDPRPSPTPAQVVLLESLIPEGAVVCTSHPETVAAAVLDALCVTPR